MSAPGGFAQAAGARASATAMTAALGGTTALVRLPSPPMAATPEEELGLPAPEFHDIPLKQCVVRTRSDGSRGGSRELLVAAPVLEEALGVTDALAAKLTLADAAFVQVGGESLLLQEVQSSEAFGRAFLYRLCLREADAEVRR